MKYKGVIFDFNGTLFFDNDKHILAWNEISHLIRGCSISDEELHNKINGVPNAEIIRYLLDGYGSREEIHYYSLLKEDYYRDYCKQDKESFHLVKGATDYFEFLMYNLIPFTICSVSIKENIDFFIDCFELDQWMFIEDIVYEDGSYKNKVNMYKQASQNIGIPIEDCLIFEDSKSGIRDAYKAGCRHIVVVNSANKKDEYKKLPGVVEVIEDFSEIERTGDKEC